MNEDVLPADLYEVVNRAILSESDRDVLMMLYMPIIGADAITLYLTLYTELKLGQFITLPAHHHHLMVTMGRKLSDIKNARIKLEAIGLMKSYVHENSVKSFVYELYSPLPAYDFFSHPILNMVLYNNVGKEEYDRLKGYFKMPEINLKEYKDITVSIDESYKTESFTSFEIENKDIIKKDIGMLTYSLDYDFDLLISSINSNVFNPKCLNKSMKELILNLSFLYSFDPIEMAEIIKTCLNEKGNIDKEQLRINSRKFYQYNNDNRLPSLIYMAQPEFARSPVGDNSNRGRLIKVFETTSPYEFLRSKNKGVKPNEKDMKVLETLLVDYRLNPAVINVLVDYVLKTNNGKLTKNYCEAIASQWKRMNIETAREAMEIAEAEHKKYSKNTKTVSEKKSVVPIWFDKELNKESTKEEQEELEELLKEFR